MDQITKIAWDLNESSENRYELVYQIAELAKKMIDEMQMRRPTDDFGDFDNTYESSLKKEKPVQHAIMIKASENDDGELVG
ncbi:MAG: hypothetical protein PHX18_05000 [Candidatus Gastranaerophilales bacterium]|nr:hypothetical protein [Candidatus Gastranaerophilales bacterium]